MSVRLPALSFGALVVGSVIAVDPGGLSPFGPSKWLVVSTLACATAGLALRRSDRRCEPRTWWMWTVLLGLLTLSALVNGDAKVALFGHPDRHLGVLTWVLLFALFCAGQQLADEVTLVGRAGVIAAAALGVYSLWELLFGPPIAVATTTRRLLGPFGSAAMLGAACCLLGPVVLGVAFDRSQDRRWRLAGGLSAVLLAIAVLGTGTRAAWIGVAVTAVAVIVAVRPTRHSVLWCAAGVVAAVSIVAPRLHEVSSRSDSSSSRSDEWRIAARVIGGHPIVGVGPEGYRIAISERIDDAYERAYRRDTVLPDRAHSGPLDVTLAGGLAAGLLYIVLLGFVGWRSWRLMRSKGPPAVGIGAAVIAYGVQQLLLFPLAELDPIWWLFGGLVVALSSTSDSIVHRRVVVPVLAAATSMFMLVIGVLDVAADRLARTALRATDHDDAVDAADRAVALRPDDMRYRLVAAEALLDRGTLADIDRAVAEARRATDWSSKDPFAIDELATAMSQRAVVTGETSDANAALAQWRHLVEGDPHRARWQLQLGRAAALAGDNDLARQAWLVAEDLGEPGATELLDALDASS
ncbi:MAG: O-antigen ligase family protein [Ilumatobacteraceae bacterium]